MKNKYIKSLKMLHKYWFILLILVINSCQNTTEPIGVTKPNGLSVSVMDQYDNYIIDSKVYFSIIKNSTVIETKELPGSSTGKFFILYDAPVMQENISIRVIVIPPQPPITNDFVNQSPDTLFFAQCLPIDTIVRFSRQRTVNQTCNCGDEVQMIINDIDSTGTISVLGMLDRNSFGSDIRIEGFNILPADVIVNVFSGSSVSTMTDLGTLTAGGGFTIPNNNYYQFRYTFAPLPREARARQTVKAVYKIKYPFPAGTNECQCTVSFTTEALKKDNCECQTFSPIVYPPTDTAAVCISSRPTDFTIPLNSIINANKDCELIITPTKDPADNFTDQRVSVVTVNGESAYNAPYTLAPGENLNSMVIRLQPTSPGNVITQATYNVKRKNSQGVEIDCGNFTVTFKGKISQGQCVVLGGVTAATPLNIFTTIQPIPNSVYNINQCIDNVDPSLDKIIYIQNIDSKCPLPIYINLSPSSMFEIVGYNLPVNDTVYPGMTKSYRIRFHVYNWDVWPSGNFSDNPILNFRTTLSIRTGGIDVNQPICNSDYILEGQPLFNCNKAVGADLEEWGVPVNSNGKRYEQGYILELSSNGQNVLVSMNNDKIKHDVYCQSINTTTKTATLASGTGTSFTVLFKKVAQNYTKSKATDLCTVNAFRSFCNKNSTGWTPTITMNEGDMILITFTNKAANLGYMTFYGLIYVKEISDRKENPTEVTSHVAFDLCYPYYGM